MGQQSRMRAMEDRRGSMMWGRGLLGLLVRILIIVAVAALLRCPFSRGRAGAAKYHEHL